ncbi:MAG TPA: DUF1015 domain-containing protein [Actinomycetota bacterium]|nr:DUF1015 domain-containing protein [Actinomycetota bacterium]
MPRVAPFEALIYDARVVGPIDRVTARPYDVTNEHHRAGYHAASPYNVSRVDLPDGDAPAPYEEAAALLATWIADGAVVPAGPMYVAYEMGVPPSSGGGRVRGVIAAMTLEPWGGDVLPHEEVMDGAVEDRLQLLRATGTHLSAIYGAVPGPVPELAALFEDLGEPDVTVVDEEDVTHRAWWVDPSTPVDVWLDARSLLIADGHHRYTTALAYRDALRATHGLGPWDRVLTFIVDAAAQDLAVLPYHRVQRAGAPLPGGEPAGSVTAAAAARADDPPAVAVLTRGTAGLEASVHRLAGDGPAVVALHRAGLDEAAPGNALTFTPSTDDAVAAVRDGGAVAAYLLPSTTPQAILDVVRTGGRLPRKSTYFWPKPRTGIVMMPVAAPALQVTAPPAPPAS